MQTNEQEKTRLYADDTSLSYSASKFAEIDIILNNILKKLKEWVIKWIISFNPAKTEAVLISNILHDYDLRLIYDDIVLNIVEIHKHFGSYMY